MNAVAARHAMHGTVYKGPHFEALTAAQVKQGE